MNQSHWREVHYWSDNKRWQPWLSIAHCSHCHCKMMWSWWTWTDHNEERYTTTKQSVLLIFVYNYYGKSDLRSGHQRALLPASLLYTNFSVYFRALFLKCLQQAGRAGNPATLVAALVKNLMENTSHSQHCISNPKQPGISRGVSAIMPFPMVNLFTLI